MTKWLISTLITVLIVGLIGALVYGVSGHHDVLMGVLYGVLGLVIGACLVLFTYLIKLFIWND